MQHNPQGDHGWQATSLPTGLDCETLMLLRRFIAPILKTGTSWQDISRQLDAKGYGIAFRDGHLVILNETGAGLCTGRSLGVPLREISERIGRPCIRANSDGHTGELH